MTYKVLDNMQVMACDSESMWAIGTAKEGTKVGEYDDVTDILLPPPPPEPPKPSEVDLLKKKLDEQIELNALMNANFEGFMEYYFSLTPEV